MSQYLIDLLIKGMKFDHLKDLRNVIPKEPVVYAWFDKKDDTLVYVGKAEGGLYQRIIEQHLRPSYLLTDKTKWTTDDWFQIKNPAMVKGEPAIDKSAFRKNVARINQIRPGSYCVDFIKDNFCLRFITLQNKEDIKTLEKVIRDTKPKPKYNII